MILIHRPVAAGSAESLNRIAWQPDEPIPADALWIDLVEPTREEDRLVETHLGISIPTRQEMADIEPSEILYRENDARYMTARVICHAETELPKLVDVTFILTERALVTVRYDEPRSLSCRTPCSKRTGAASGARPASAARSGASAARGT
jgi:magnesium transporter